MQIRDSTCHLPLCIAAVVFYDTIPHDPLLSCPEPGSRVIRSSAFTWLKSPECCRFKCYVLILCLAIHRTAIQTPLVLLFYTLLWLFGPFLRSLFLSTRPLVSAAPSNPSNWTHSHRSVLLTECQAQHLFRWISWTTDVLKCVKKKMREQIPRRPYSGWSEVDPCVWILQVLYSKPLKWLLSHVKKQPYNNETTKGWAKLTKHVGFIVWAPWMSVQNVEPVHPVHVDIYFTG